MILNRIEQNEKKRKSFKEMYCLKFDPYIHFHSNFIAGYYIFYGSVRLQIKFIGKKFFQ